MFDVTHRILLKPERDGSVNARHPWIFSGAVDRVESLAGAEDGDPCDVLNAKGEWIARGTLHRSSQIVCRVLTWRKEPIDHGFFLRRIDDAWALRSRTVDVSETDAYRLVNAEGDRIPGLIVDRYGDFLVVQCLTAGMLRLEPFWRDALVERFAPRAIVDRSERAVRDPSVVGRNAAIHGDPPSEPVWVRESGFRYRVHLGLGQKTGFYLDQRENRALAGSLAAGRDVLNGFAYTGAFGMHAARGGARSVVQVESSAPALEEARAHWETNGLSSDIVTHVHQDVFRFLREDQRLFDLIVLDPPPYAKDRASVDRASRAYKDLNLWAIRRLAPGGILMTFSCSQHIGVDLFQKILFGAAKDARASMQWLRRLGPGVDHPVHMDHPQGEYLKGFLLRLIESAERRGPDPAS